MEYIIHVQAVIRERGGIEREERNLETDVQ